MRFAFKFFDERSQGQVWEGALELVGYFVDRQEHGGDDKGDYDAGVCVSRE